MKVLAFKNGEIICDAPSEEFGVSCGRMAIRYGQDADYKPVDLCDQCSVRWYLAVCDHKMPMPKIKCSVCGKEKILSCAEYSTTMNWLDNRSGKRNKNPIYVCPGGHNLIMLGFATLSNGKVLFSWQETEVSKMETVTV